MFQKNLDNFLIHELSKQMYKINLLYLKTKPSQKKQKIK
jgi:hypothetical protein